ncbi:MAG: hypothetical protein RL757_2188 [Bacteroidota bacterium]
MVWIVFECPPSQCCLVKAFYREALKRHANITIVPTGLFFIVFFSFYFVFSP